jgi:hypothetical protein
MTKPLSPAARAVLYDAHNRWLDVDDDIAAQVAAAALRAAALVPNIDRLRLLAMADELEGEQGADSRLLQGAAEE